MNEKDKNFNPKDSYWQRERSFSDLLGKTLISVENNGNEEIKFICDDGREYRQVYYQDCCASCSVDEIHGDLEDLVGSPILLAEVVTSRENPEGVTKEHQDSFTWAFYKLSTIKGSVTIRWYGESNGYYSEEATFERVK